MVKELISFLQIPFIFFTSIIIIIFTQIILIQSDPCPSFLYLSSTPLNCDLSYFKGILDGSTISSIDYEIRLVCMVNILLILLLNFTS